MLFLKTKIFVKFIDFVNLVATYLVTSLLSIGVLNTPACCFIHCKYTSLGMYCSNICVMAASVILLSLHASL